MSADLPIGRWSVRDWTEDFSLENGMYSNHCVACHEQFVGYKRRVVCKLCATKERP